MTQKIFFDLEFSDLKSNARLISAAFVDEQNDSLYIEIETQYWQPYSSEFVIEVVKPLLRGDGLPAQQGSAKIGGWLNARGPELILVSDSDWDWRMLRRHFKLTGYVWPFFWQWENVRYLLNGNQRKMFNSAYAEWFLRSGHVQHHALNDAQALRDAYVATLIAHE